MSPIDRALAIVAGRSPPPPPPWLLQVRACLVAAREASAWVPAGARTPSPGVEVNVACRTAAGRLYVTSGERWEAPDGREMWLVNGSPEVVAWMAMPAPPDLDQ